MRTILFLSANPKDTERLRLDEEIRQIEESLRRSKHCKMFSLQQRWAVRPQDVQSALLDVEPQVVHFSGHGSIEGGIYLENNFGNSQLVDVNSLSELFSLFQTVECVFLNYCYSEQQANAIAQHVDYMVGSTTFLDDNYAIKFA